MMTFAESPGMTGRRAQIRNAGGFFGKLRVFLINFGQNRRLERRLSMNERGFEGIQ
jgi:hypothetical protein